MEPSSVDSARTVVLLGAGASVEAGLHASLDLTKAIAEQVESGRGRWDGASQALHLAIGSMIAHDTSMGGGAFDRVDVERLFSAIQMLADRDNLEIAPFVAAWNGSLDSLGRHQGLSSSFGREFQRELFSDFGPSGLDRLFADGVQSVIGRQPSIDLFKKLEGHMIDALQVSLTVDPANVDYLAPLLPKADERIQVATLNYDLSIELLADRAGCKLDTGVGQWEGGFEWNWQDDAQLRLLKLHGSLDWYRGEENAPGKLPQERITVARDWTSDAVYGASLAVVFGQRGKLRSDGPFLAMLNEFEKFLKSADRLVIVGYSLRDAHINAAIRRWFNRTAEPQLTIIDPGLPEDPLERLNEDSFLRALLDAMAEGPRWNRTGFRPGLQLVRSFAGTGLREVFGEGRPLPPV